MAKIRGLGKGLASLIPTAATTEPLIPEEITETEQETLPEEAPGEFAPIDRLLPNPYQPRKQIDRDSLSNLAASISEHGVIQPVLVRRVESGYQIVAGERRWRAARVAGLEEIPIRVMEIGDEQARELALVENLQREDLTPIETARGLQELITHLGLTHEDAARKIGLSRVAVTNKLRLLQLPPQVHDLLERGILSEGHARALLALPDESKILDAAITASEKSLNVRQLEELVRNQSNQAKMDAVFPAKPDNDFEIPHEIEDLCRSHKLTIRVGGGRKGMGLMIRGLKRWQVQLILEHIDKHREEIFPAE